MQNILDTTTTATSTGITTNLVQLARNKSTRLRNLTLHENGKQFKIENKTIKDMNVHLYDAKCFNCPF